MGCKTVVTVLRSGGDFRPEHVQALHRQVLQWAPSGTEFVCLTDVGVDGVACLPLEYDWPGWWSKIEMFRPDIANYLGDFLFTDLDNVIVGPIEDLLTPDTYTTQAGGWNALSFIPEHVRAPIWNDFIREPVQCMRRFDRSNQPIISGVGNYGDAGFVSSHLPNAQYWEEKFPGQVINMAATLRVPARGPLKAHVKPVPADTRIVLCSTPQGRPWLLPMFQHLY